MKQIYIILAFFTSILCMCKVDAQVLAQTVPSAAIEETNVLIKGENFNSGGNNLKITATDPNGVVVNLDTKILSRSKFLVTMPSVSTDTKVLLSVSGGNVPSSDAQVFVLLVIDKPNNAPGESSSTDDDDFGGDDNGSTSEPGDDTTPPGLAKNIVDLPNLGFIGNSDLRTTVRGDLKVNDDLVVDGDTNINGKLTAKNFEGTFTGPVIFKMGSGLNLQNDGTELASDDTQRSLNVENKNLFHLNNTDVDRLGALTGATAGQKVIILFNSSIEVVDYDDHSTNTIDLHNGNTVFTDDSSLELIYDGHSWYETSRSIN